MTWPHKLTAVATSRYGHGHLYYWGSDFVIGSALAAFGEWFESEVDVFRFYVKEGDTVIDCGANVGAHTVALASLVGKDGLVVAIEPQRPMFQLMCANAITNGYLNVHPVLAALSDQAGYRCFDELDYAELKSYGGFRTTRDAELNSAGVATRMERLDDLWLSHFVKPVSFIKLDVEGSECEAIAGAEVLIKNCRPVLYIENDRPENSAKLIKLLLDLDYNLHWHIAKFYNPDNIMGRADDVPVHRYFWDGKQVNGASIMLLCLPQESLLDLPPVPGLKPVVSVDEYPPFDSDAGS